jgi:hypothetical protein
MTPEEDRVPDAPDVEPMLDYFRARARVNRRRRIALRVGGLAGGGLVVAAVLSLVLRPAPLADPASENPPPVSGGNAFRAMASAPVPAPEPAPASPAPSRPATEHSPMSGEPASSASRSEPANVTVRYPPRERLDAVQPGDPKERVFELFGRTVERHNGTLIRTEGMLLRASGQSPDHGRIEVAEVGIDGKEAVTPYWFLFGDGRLVAWGRPEEWAAAASRYRLDVEYR